MTGHMHQAPTHGTWGNIDGTGESRPAASRGQILIMFALFLVGLLGILGLATDLGMAFAQRRTMQNAADAGALAGARAVARWTASNPTSAQTDAASLVAANQMNTVPSMTDCHYIDYGFSNLGSCGSTVPAAATGIQVTVEEAHQTFFIRLVPGAPETVTVRATAAAHVERYDGFPKQAPFIVCGSNSWAVIDQNGTSYSGQGADIPILISNGAGEYAINPNAVGVTFRIHDPQIGQTGNQVKKNAGCGNDSAEFNGLADQDANGSVEVGWHYYKSGTVAGPTRETVNGVEGCAANTSDPYNCVMFLPIAVNDPDPDTAATNHEIWVVGYAAFFVTRPDANSHNARLIDDYIASGPSTEDWCRSCNNGVVVIRLSK